MPGSCLGGMPWAKGGRAAFLAWASALMVGSWAQAQDKPPLTVDDYGPWKRIGSVALSPDGSWMSWATTPNEGEDTLYVQALDKEDRLVLPRGTGSAFSRDSRWVAYFLAPPQRGSGSGAAQRPPIPTPSAQAQGGGAAQGRTLVLRNLVTGDTIAFPDAASFSFPENTDLLLVRKRGPAGGAGYSGADLVVHHLTAGTSLNLGNVSEFSVNKGGTHLAYLVDAQGKAGNGLYLLELAFQAIRPLDTRSATYSRLTWNREGTALAALRGEVPEKKTQRANVLLVLRDLSRQMSLEVMDPESVLNFPEGFVFSELAPLRWSSDGARLFVGIKEQAESREELAGRANVDVWHWADVEVQSVQQVRAARNRDRTWAGVVNLGPGRLSFVRLAEESLETVTQAGGSRWGIGRDPRPYRYEVSWGGSRADYYRVNLDSGERTLLAKGVGRTVSTSPAGDWWLYLRDEHVIARNLATGKEVDLTETSGVDFIDRQDDHPYELPTYGSGGWTKDGRSVLLYDRYDVWVVPVEGGRATNLTRGLGARERIRFRVSRLGGPGGGGPGGPAVGGGGEEEEGVDLSKTVLLSAFGERTKKSGYFEVRLGSDPQPLYWVEKVVGRPIKAAAADRILFTQETFVEFPDYWVSDTRFRNPRKVTDANPQLTHFAWSPGRVLIDYTDGRGNELQATLALPAGYEPGKRYPMLVYFYELMSDQHHRFSMPVYDDRPHMSTYASNGYLVLQPDIVYTIGKPGTSALDDLTAAVKRVVELGYADPARVGLQGHSWGGYQSSFVVTQTDLFAAVVTGAPPTNLVSFYNTLYKSTGTVQQGITEVGQVRMGTTPFDDLDLFVSQSPVHHAAKISTPFLILHGTADGAVDWMQGLEFYNMARRLGKKVIFLSYPDEEHHLTRKENRIDFQIRMMQFFDHYLKGAPAPKWMVEGVPFLEKNYANPREMTDGTLWGKPPSQANRTGAGRGGALH